MPLFYWSFHKRSLQDFVVLKTALQKEIKQTRAQIIVLSNQVLELITANGIEFSDFIRSSLPNYFKALSSGKFDIKYDAIWQQTIETTSLYPKTTAAHIAETIEALRPQLVDAFHKTKQGAYRLRYLKNIRKNTTPLSVLNLINQELKTIKEEENLLMISEFNTIISQQIKEQPAPFIYERIGEQFNHFFIDEFQDTSELQWENLVPLLTNALAEENGSVMLVGDAKQAIYRWRGGKAEQFINLHMRMQQIFLLTRSPLHLPTNYRSCRKVVAFNNSFFKHLSTVVFSNETYKSLYQSTPQLEFNPKTGYVNISLLEFEKGADKSLLYAEKVLSIITAYLASDEDAAWKDICVLGS